MAIQNKQGKKVSVNTARQSSYASNDLTHLLIRKQKVYSKELKISSKKRKTNQKSLLLKNNLNLMLIFIKDNLLVSL